MAELTFPVAHGDIAWNNWPIQFVGKVKLEAFVRGIFVPFDELETALRDLTQKRGVTTSEGVQLNGVGEIVGQLRYLEGAFLLPFFGYEGQPSITGYDQARYRRLGESNEDAANVISDAAYRKLINWKIVVNTAAGTVEDVIRAMRAIFPNASKVIVTNPTPRHLNVRVLTSSSADEIFVSNATSFVPRIAGHTVSVSVETA